MHRCRPRIVRRHRMVRTWDCHRVRHRRSGDRDSGLEGRHCVHRGMIDRPEMRRCDDERKQQHHGHRERGQTVHIDTTCYPGAPLDTDARRALRTQDWANSDGRSAVVGDPPALRPEVWSPHPHSGGKPTTPPHAWPDSEVWPRPRSHFDTFALANRLERRPGAATKPPVRGVSGWGGRSREGVVATTRSPGRRRDPQGLSTRDARRC